MAVAVQGIMKARVKGVIKWQEEDPAYWSSRFYLYSPLGFDEDSSSTLTKSPFGHEYLITHWQCSVPQQAGAVVGVLKSSQYQLISTKTYLHGN